MIIYPFFVHTVKPTFSIKPRFSGHGYDIVGDNKRLLTVQIAAVYIQYVITNLTMRNTEYNIHMKPGTIDP